MRESEIMSQAHKASRLLLRNQIVGVDFNSAHFNFNQDTFGIQNGDIVKPKVTAVASIKPIEGKFGGAVCVDDTTTNLSLIADSRWVISKNNYQGTMVITTSTTDSFFATSARYDFKPRLVPTGSGWQVAQYNHGIASYTTGNVYTASLYVRKLNSYDGLQVRMLNGDGTQQQGTSFYMPAGFPVGQWTRLQMTWTPTVTSGGVQFYVSANENASFELANPQVEVKPYLTSFVVGSRDNPNLTYDGGIVNKDEFTISSWVYVDDKPSPSGLKYLFSINNGVNDGRFNFFIVSYGGYTIKWEYYTAAQQWAFISNVGVNLGAWNHIAITYSRTAGKGAVFINGVKSVASLSLPVITNPFLNFMIGTDFTGFDSNLNGLVDELKVDNYVQPDEEILAMYLSGFPLYNPYDYRGYAY
jgi:hypothetical protein